MMTQRGQHASTTRSTWRSASDKLSLPTPWPEGRRSTLAIVAVAGFAFLLIPRGGWVGDHLHKEDGTIFLTQQLHGGLSHLFTIYSGYVHVGPRLVVAACATATTSHLPACIATSTAALRVAMMLLAFPLLAAYAKTWRWGLAAASLFLFLPAGQWEALGNVTNLRWFLVPTVVLVLLSVYDSVALVVLACVFVAVGALSDPLAAILLPLGLWRALSVKGIARVPALAFLPAALVQLVLMHPSQRGAGLGPQQLVHYPIDAIKQLVVRGFDATQYGITGTEVILHVAGTIGAIAALALPVAVVVMAARSGWNASLRLATVLLAIGTLLFFGTIIWDNISALGFAHWFDLGNLVNRYSVGIGLLLGPALILACSTLWDDRRAHRALAATSLGVLGLAALGDFRGDKYNVHGPIWSTSVAAAVASCPSGSSKDVTMVITPVGVGTSWTTTVPCSWLRGG